MAESLPRPFREDRLPDLAAEHAALACLIECVAQLGLSEVPIPVPVELWIEWPLGCDFGFEKMDGLLGYAEPAARIVRISDSISDERRIRWTAAHELGHIRLGELASVGVATTDPRYTMLYENDAERQAERFAAAFLMPIRSLTRALFELSRQHQLDPDDTIPSLLCRTDRTFDLWSRVFVPGLASHFNVLPAGVLFRLGELHLDDGAPMLLPGHIRALAEQVL